MVLSIIWVSYCSIAGLLVSFITTLHFVASLSEYWQLWNDPDLSENTCAQVIIQVSKLFATVRKTEYRKNHTKEIPGKFTEDHLTPTPCTRMPTATLLPRTSFSNKTESTHRIDKHFRNCSSFLIHHNLANNGRNRAQLAIH